MYDTTPAAIKVTRLVEKLQYEDRVSFENAPYSSPTDVKGFVVYAPWSVDRLASVDTAEVLLSSLNLISKPRIVVWDVPPAPVGEVGYGTVICDSEKVTLKILKSADFELLAPLLLDVNAGGEGVSVYCGDLELYGYGKSREDALSDFESLLIDTFRFLKKKRGRLAKNLSRQLESIEQVLVANGE